MAISKVLQSNVSAIEHDSIIIQLKLEETTIIKLIENLMMRGINEGGESNFKFDEAFTRGEGRHPKALIKNWTLQLIGGFGKRNEGETYFLPSLLISTTFFETNRRYSQLAKSILSKCDYLTFHPDMYVQSMYMVYTPSNKFVTKYFVVVLNEPSYHRENTNLIQIIRHKNIESNQSLYKLNDLYFQRYSMFQNMTTSLGDIIQQERTGPKRKLSSSNMEEGPARKRKNIQDFIGKYTSPSSTSANPRKTSTNPAPPTPSTSKRQDNASASDKPRKSSTKPAPPTPPTSKHQDNVSASKKPRKSSTKPPVPTPSTSKPQDNASASDKPRKRSAKPPVPTPSTSKRQDNAFASANPKNNIPVIKNQKGERFYKKLRFNPFHFQVSTYNSIHFQASK